MSDLPLDSRYDKLALLYLQAQDLTGKTPEDVVAMYWDTYYRIQVSGNSARTEILHKRRIDNP